MNTNEYKIIQNTAYIMNKFIQEYKVFWHSDINKKINDIINIKENDHTYDHTYDHCQLMKEK